MNENRFDRDDESRFDLTDHITTEETPSGFATDEDYLAVFGTEAGKRVLAHLVRKAMWPSIDLHQIDSHLCVAHATRLQMVAEIRTTVDRARNERMNANRTRKR